MPEAKCDNCVYLEAENEKLKRTMRLHAGDCCSLSNEVDLFRGHWEAEEEISAELQTKLKAAEKEILSQKEHIKLLNDCDDSSTKVIGKMGEEIRQLQTKLKEKNDQ